MERQQPARIARPQREVVKQTVEESSMVELVQEVIARCEDERRSLTVEMPDGSGPGSSVDPLTAGSVGRDLSLAITHLEDARTRINAAGYRLKGTFSISDSERS